MDALSFASGSGDATRISLKECVPSPRVNRFVPIISGVRITDWFRSSLS
jgi:hypothetical protein